MSKLVQNYLLQEPIGKGVYGKVYRAIHQRSKLQYAVKVIPKSVFQSNPKLEQLAINQIKILSSLKNQHIVRFVQTLKTPNNFYFVYQYCNGGTLDHLLSRKKILSQQQALKIFSQLVEAFKQLNKNSVMHRDLKPDNVFLADGKVKLGDFGFCKMLEVNMAQTMLGSPIYMAPEILREEIYTSKADIWSLGVVLFQMLFGYCPFESNSISQLINVLKETQLVIPTQINEISQGTKTLLEKMLIKDQFKRIQWVDLFQYKVDQQGNLHCPTNKKDLSIETLQNYFLFNRTNNNNSIVNSQRQLETNKYQGSKLKYTNTSKNLKIQQNTQIKVDSSKKIDIQDSHQYKKNVNNLINNPMNQFPSIPIIQGIHRTNYPQLSSDKVINNIQTQKKQHLNQQQNYHLESQIKIGLTQPIKHNNETNNNTNFQNIHQTWTRALDIMSEFSQNPKQSEQIFIHWMLISLLRKINRQCSNHPQWTDVLLEQKKFIIEALRQLNIYDYKLKDSVQCNNDGKNEILKLWKKSATNHDNNENLWQKAIKFMYAQNENSDYTPQQLLLI